MRIHLSRGTRAFTAAAIAIVVLASIVTYAVVSGPGSGRTTTAATQVSPYFVEYQTPGTDTLPNAVAVDSAGNVWTVLQNKTELAEYTPQTSSFRTFPFPEPAGTKVMTWGLAVDDSRHLLWVADETSDAVWSFNLTSQRFRETSIPTVGATPFQVVVDGRGDAWFTEFVGDRIGVVTPDGALAERPIPLAGNPTGIAVDQLGRVWFNLLQPGTSGDQYYIGSYLGGSFSFYNITGRVDTPVGIAVDGSGHVWLTQHGASLLSEYTLATGQLRTYSTSIPKVGASYPYFVYVDPASGRVWFNEHYGNAIGTLDPADGRMVEYRLPPGPSVYGNISGVLTIAPSASGTPWFAEVYTGRIGTLNTSAPVDLSLSVSGGGQGGAVRVSNGSAANLEVRVVGAAGARVALSAAVGNLSDPLQVSFAPAVGSGAFAAGMVVSDPSGQKGSWLVTVSATSGYVTVSQVVELDIE